MSSHSIEEAKIQYLKTGRLNRKLVRDEIALSWYRCQLNNLDFLKNEFKTSSHLKSVNEVQVDLQTVRELMKTYNKEGYNSFILHLDGSILEKIIYDGVLDEIPMITEEIIGTNAGSLTLKSGNFEKVELHEHYLDCFRHYYSYCFPIKRDETLVGAYYIMVNSPILEEEQNRIKSLVTSQRLEIKSHPTSEKPEDHLLDINQFLIVSEAYAEEIDMKIGKMTSVNLPIYIWGPKGSGKSNLSWYISQRILKTVQFIDLKKIPSVLREKIIETSLSQYDTVIIDSIEVSNANIQKMLTVYSERILSSKKLNEATDYRCLNLIVTSVYSPKELMEIHNFNERFVSRICQQAISTENLVDPVINDRAMNQLLERYQCNYTEGFRNFLIKLSEGKSVIEVAEILENTMSKVNNGKTLTREDLVIKNDDAYVTLSELERDYIINVYNKMNENITLTSEILGIGRSTLYRKLKMYQIETKP